MQIVVIDGQGGGIGKALVEQLKKQLPQGTEVLGIGLNAIATSSMIKAGADGGATGEHAVCYNCQTADIIAGPVGLMFVGSMLGEVSPAIAHAISSSRAEKVLIPISKCHAHVAGVKDQPIGKFVEDALGDIQSILQKK